MKLKKGDTIIVTAGKDKKKKGKVEAVFFKEGAVAVAGVNMYKRHMKKRDEKNPGGIIDMTRPIPVANVALLCPTCKQQTRVGFLVTKASLAGRQGEKIRICRKCEAKI